MRSSPITFAAYRAETRVISGSQVSDDRERDKIHQRADADRGEQSARFVSRRAAIEKRHEEQPCGREAEADDPNHLSLDSQNVAWQKFQRVKHREKVPLR